MQVIYSDGGRSKYFKGETRDCACRAICNATGEDYLKIYNRLNEIGKTEHIGKRKRFKSDARKGVAKTAIDKVLKELGWQWHATMGIGTGCQVHLRAEELPRGVIVCNCSRHLTCVKDGVVYDTFDCTRDGTRCVYGYWYK